MTKHSAPYSPTLDIAVEDEIRALLVQHFAPIYHDRADSYVAMILAIDHYVSRFQYLQTVIGSGIVLVETRILISGFGVGSEMIAARQFGFGKVCGVEVDRFLVSACESRLRYLPDTYPTYYDGDYLPYDDAQFEVVASGHVIEHTRSPELYLQECMRVLIPHGYLSLEFPTRYHRTELHTQLPSFEWLPRPIRNATIRILSDRFSPLNTETKSRYHSIISTNLQQISMGGIQRMLKRIAYPFAILNHVEAAPGIIRCVIQKGPLNKQ